MANVQINMKLGTKLSESLYNSTIASGTGGDAGADLTTAFTAADTFGAAVIAITGDAYSTTTHQFTTSGSTGLTHAQWVTLAAEYNTAIADFVAAQAALGSADLTVIINTAVVNTYNAFYCVVRKVLSSIGGLGIFTK